MAGYLVTSAADQSRSYAHYSVLPSAYVNGCQQAHPGWLDTQLEAWSRVIDARLRKRCVVPFETAPLIVRMWLAQIVDDRLLTKLGTDPLDIQSQQIKANADAALKDLAEAADSQNSKFDLPYNDADDATAMHKGVPKGHSESSPFVWRDVQRATGRREDERGKGTRR